MIFTGKKFSALAVAAIALIGSACGDDVQSSDVATPRLKTLSQGLGLPPVNSLPTMQTTNEDSQLTFSGLGGNALSVSDGDSGLITVQITVTHGVFVPKTGKDVTITGSGTFSVILSGPIDEVNKALIGAVYRPAPDYSGPAELQMNSSDSDGNSDFDVVSITVTPFNDPPVNSVPTGIQTATEDVPRSFNIPVVDVDIGTGDLIVSLTASNGTRITLPAGTLAPLTFSGGSTGTNESAMTFTGKLPDVNAALNGLTITPPLDYIGTSTLTITANDQHTGVEGPGTDTDTLTISWSPVNDAPVNSVPANQTTDEEVPLTFSVANANALSVADVDATTAFVQVTLDAQGGRLSLGSTQGLSFSVGDGTADATMTFSGTLNALNAALNGTMFVPNPNFAGDAIIKLISNDLGNSGAGGARQDTDTVVVHVLPVNDAPTHQVPPAQVTNEDVARAFSTANGNVIAVADVDAPTLQVTLTAQNGTLTLSRPTGISFQSGDGNADASMTFTGTSASLNSALNGLLFAPTPNYAGPASITIVTSDLGATGTGGAKTAQSTIPITVDPVNDAPDAVNDAITLAEDAPATQINVLANDTALPDTGETLVITAVANPAHGAVTWTAGSVSYAPNANFHGTDSFTYTISDGNGGTDTALVTVTVTSVNDIPTVVADSVTVLEDSGPVTVSVLSNDSTAPDLNETLTITQVGQAAHGTVAIINGGTAVTYTPAPGYAGPDAFTYTVSDGNGGIATGNVTVSVETFNTTPVNTLPPPQQTIEDTQLLFSAAAGNAISVADANNSTLTIQVAVTNGTFTLGSTTGLTVTGNGSATVTAQGTLTALNNGLNNARYVPTANFHGLATLTLSANDSNGESDLDVLNLTVTSINDAPINTVPSGVQAATEDVPKTFTSILVSDVDVESSQLLVTLTANNGTVVSLSDTRNLTFLDGTLSGTPTLKFTGTPVDINSALNGLTVTPPPNFIGNSTLTIVTNDQGSTGGGGPGEDTDVIQLSWSAVNDAPVNSLPTALSTTEEFPLTLSGAQAIRVSDSDVSAGLLQVTLNVQGGTLSLATVSGLTLGAGDGTADATMTFSGTVSAINTALDGATFAPLPNFAGTANVTITTSDLGNSGAGGAKQDIDTLAIHVTAVNDAPQNFVPGTQSTNEDVPRAFSVANGNPISVADVDAASLQVSVSVTNGTLSLSGKNGLSFQSGDGTTDGSMTFTGTVAAVNAALNGLVFAPSPNFFGAAELTVLTSDLGATGQGGALTQQDLVAITVNPVNDPPDAVNDQLTLPEDSPATVVPVLANDTYLPDDGETLTIVSITQPSNGSVVLASGVITYVPNPNYYGADSFSYTVSDGAATDTATVAVTVTSVNDVPNAVADSVTVLQNSGPNAVNVLSNDSAAPDLGETLTVMAVSDPPNGAAAITGGGTGVTYSPDLGFTGSDSFTYTLSDGNGGTAVATVSVNVAAVNTQPVNSLPAPQQLIEDTQLVFSTAAGNAITVSDANNTALTVQIAVTDGAFTLGSTTGLTVTGNNGATVTAQGTITSLNAGLNGAKYVPTPNFSGPATLTVHTNDSNGESDLDVLTLTVSSVNDAPVNTVPTGAQAAVEDVPKTFTNILVSDVDVGASQLQMTLTANNGTTITLPTTAGLAFTTGDGTADPTMVFTGTPVDINAALNGLTVTPPANFIGQSTLLIVTNDLGNTGNGGPAQDSDQLVINWASDNDPPINAVPGPQSTLEETPFVFSSANATGLTVADADSGAGLVRVTLSATNGRVTLGNPSGVTLSAGTGVADTSMTFSGTLNAVNAALDGTSFLPNRDFVGTATVTLQSNDQGNTGGAAKSDTDTVSITVNGINDAPVNTIPNPQFIAEDGLLILSTANGNAVSVADVDAPSLRVTLSTGEGTLALTTKTNLTFQAGDGNAAPSMTFSGPLGAVNSALNTLRFAPTPNYSGPATITMISEDLGLSGIGGALRDEDVLSVSVMPVNDNPTAVADVLTVGEDSGPTQVNVLANDTAAPDTGEVLSITSVTSPKQGTATTNGSLVTYQPNPNYFGTDSFTYTISDGQGGVASATVTVTVLSINDPPDAVADTLTVVENAAATLVPVLANDTFAPDVGETLTITAVTSPQHGTATIVNAGAGLQYQPVPGYFGPDQFTYTVSDGNGGTDTTQVSVTVTPFDYKPAAVPDTLTVTEDSSGSVDVLANDTGLGNKPLTVVVAANPTHGTAVVQPDDTILYTPAPNFQGTDGFTYTVTDANGDASTGMVTVTVTNVDDIPVAVADEATTDEDVSVRIEVQLNDQGLVDVPITLAVSTPPVRGSAMVEADGTITYLPADNFHGEDAFQYAVTDADGQRSTAEVRVTVLPINDAPLALPEAVSTRAGEALLVDVLANDTDVEGDALLITSVTVPANGAATIMGERIRYAPVQGFSGSDSFEYTIADPEGLTSTAKVVVDVGIDSDGDGLGDLDELTAGTDPLVADTDGDLLSDGVEVHLAKTNPLDADTDDDGLTDGFEDANQSGTVDPGETDPTKADTDGDGLLDGTELGLKAPQTEDTDLSVFVPDEDPTTTTDPLNPDTDNGGVPDGEEDANRNGRKDRDETNPLKASDDLPNGPDQDLDGMADSVDNCIAHANASQADADGDGIGDACEAENALGCGCAAGPLQGGGLAALLGALLLVLRLGSRRGQGQAFTVDR